MGQFYPVAVAGQVDVEQHQVGLFFLEAHQCLLGRGRDAHQLVPQRPQQDTHRQRLHGVVFDGQNTDGGVKQNESIEPAAQS